MADAFPRAPDEFSEMRWFYIRLRFCRQWESAAKRRWWRKIAREKARLYRLGYGILEVHLWSRYWGNPANPRYGERLVSYYEVRRSVGFEPVGFLR